MDVFERLGVRPVLNVAGTVTRLGGALMEPEVVDSMTQAAVNSVRLDELQAAASNVIAKVTGAEAGYVTSGASAALTLGTAACLTGLDLARMDRLPDTNGMPNEVLVEHHQRSGFDHAIRAAGAKIINVGMPSSVSSPTVVYRTKAWEFESAITENTVAIACFYSHGSNPPLEQIIDIGKKYHISVIVDAAAQVPPVENLRRFISMGADLVAISGGKGIRGPQNTGILCGRRDLVAAAALQNLDMAWPSFDSWDPPSSLIPKEKLRGLPQHGIGRGMKVSKEAIVGLITALQLLSEEKSFRDLKRLRVLLQSIEEQLAEIPGAVTSVSEWNPNSFPVLEIRLDKSKLGRSAYDVSQKLKGGEPRIYTYEGRLSEDLLIIHSANLNEERAKIVCQALYRAITD